MAMTELQVLNKILDTQDSSLIIANNLNEDYFDCYKSEFNFIRDHFNTYNQIPDKATFLTKFPKFETIVVNESDEYLIKALTAEKQWGTINSCFNNLKSFYFTNDISGAIGVVSEMYESLIQQQHLTCVDILQDTASRYDAYIERCEDYGKYYIKTGFPELDQIIGGWDRQEELVTIAARTNQGKSWLLFKSAAEAVKQGLRVGIYEGEMSERKVGYRMDTMFSHISNSGIIHGNKSYQEMYKIFLDDLHSRYPNSCCKVLTPAMIGGPATVTTLRAFIERENLDILFIDQHSLLEDERKAKSPVEKAANISKDLKNLQVLKRIPLITVSQQNRTSTENGVGTEHIAQSDRIAQDSTVIIFFEQNKEHDILTMTLVKSRDSANMKKLQYSFDFDRGIFEYIPDGEEESDSAELNALNNNEINNLISEFGENINWDNGY